MRDSRVLIVARGAMSNMNNVMTKQDAVPDPKKREQFDADIKGKIQNLLDERTQLEEELRERSLVRDVEMEKAKQVTVENRAKAEEIKAQSAVKLAEQTAAHERIRKQDAEKVVAMVKQQNDNSTRIRRLEAELAGLKAMAT